MDMANDIVSPSAASGGPHQELDSESQVEARPRTRSRLASYINPRRMTVLPDVPELYDRGCRSGQDDVYIPNVDQMCDSLFRWFINNPGTDLPASYGGIVLHILEDRRRVTVLNEELREEIFSKVEEHRQITTELRHAIQMQSKQQIDHHHTYLSHDEVPLSWQVGGKDLRRSVPPFTSNPPNGDSMGTSRQPTHVDASVPTTSIQTNQDVSQYLSDPSSRTMVTVDNLARHLAVRLNLEPARLHQEIPSLHAPRYDDNTPLETAQASPRLSLIPSIQEDIVSNDYWKNEHQKAVPLPAQHSESQGHNRSFSFQRGDDPGSVMFSKHDAELYGNQRDMTACLPGAGKLCRKQNSGANDAIANTSSAEASDLDEHDDTSTDNQRSTRAHRERSTRSVMTAIRQASNRSTLSSRSSTRNIAKSRESSMGAAENHMLAMTAARTAEARDSLTKRTKHPAD